MDMSGFRMVPGRHRNDGAGRRAMERRRVRIRVRHVGGDDGRHDGALGGADDSHVRPRGSTGEFCRQAARGDGLVRRRLFPGWIGFSLAATLVQWVFERAALLDSRMASASNVLGGVVLIAAGVYQWTPLKDACLAQCQTPFSFLMRHGGFRGDVPGCLLAGVSPRNLLRRLLLGADGAFVCGRGDERALDRAPGAAGPSGEAHPVRTVDRARRRRCLCRRRGLDVVIFTAVMKGDLFLRLAYYITQKACTR